MREMIRLRRRYTALTLGSYKTPMKMGQAVVFERRHGEERFWVAVNIDTEAKRLPLRPWASTPERCGGQADPRKRRSRNGLLKDDTLKLPGLGFALLRF
jgi:hypothetical protein